MPEIAPPTPAQLAKLQKAIDASDPEFGVFVPLSAMTGARRSEVLALRWTDVDLERGVVTIGRGLSCRVRTGSWRRTPRPIRPDG
jgi:integrase